MTSIRKYTKTLQFFSLLYDRVEFPNDAVNTLSTNDHITVEQDGGVQASVSA